MCQQVVAIAVRQREVKNGARMLRTPALDVRVMICEIP
jgi:hypothetical protein